MQELSYQSFGHTEIVRRRLPADKILEISEENPKAALETFRTLVGKRNRTSVVTRQFHRAASARLPSQTRQLPCSTIVHLF